MVSIYSAKTPQAATTTSNILLANNSSGDSITSDEVSDLGSNYIPNESSSNDGRNLDSMNTIKKRNSLTKIPNSKPGTASHKGDYQRQHHRVSTLSPIARILSTDNNVTNLPFAHGKDQSESTQATPSQGTMLNRVSEPKLPTVEIIATEIITSPSNVQTSTPSTIGASTTSDYKAEKPNGTQITSNLSLGPLDEPAKLKVTLVETTTTVVPSPEHMKASDTLEQLPIVLTRSSAKKSGLNNEAAFFLNRITLKFLSHLL